MLTKLEVANIASMSFRYQFLYFVHLKFYVEEAG